jgi:hypothetical protein
MFASREEKLELLSRRIGNADSSDRWRRPRNVFPIYRYVENIVAYTDELDAHNQASKGRGLSALNARLLTIERILGSYLCRI